MKKKSTDDNKREKKDINLSLSKSKIPRDLSKYPHVNVGDGEKKDGDSVSAESSDARQQEKKKKLESVNVSLSKSKVPTDFAKYPTVTVSREEVRKNDGSSPSGSLEDDQAAENKKKLESINLSLSKSAVPTDFTKYPTVTVARDNIKESKAPDSTVELSKRGVISKEKQTNATVSTVELSKQKLPREKQKHPEGKPPTTTKDGNQTAVNETVQLKKELKVALRKSNKALDITKYPKVVVTSDEEDEAVVAQNKSTVTSQDRPRSKRKDIKPITPDSMTTEINETVQLKRGLKVALRKSASALDLSKYPKVTVGDDLNDDASGRSDSATGHNQKIKFADHIQEDKANDTVQLMKNLKLSLSKSAKAIDLNKYPKITVDADADKPEISSDAAQKQEKLKAQELKANKEKQLKEIAEKQKAEQEKLKAQELEANKEKQLKEIAEKQKAEQEKLKAQELEANKEKQLKEIADPSAEPKPVKKPKRILAPTSTPIPKIIDPTRRRDNATVRLNASHSDFPVMEEKKPENAGGDPGSDTVVLKVIKEKKKKLAGILSASQTIRLRPPSEPGFTPGSPVPPETEPAMPKKTLKLKTPGAAAESDQDQGPPHTVERRVLKLKPSVPTAETVQQPASSEGEQTTVRRSNRIHDRIAPTAKATLKIKVPAASAPVAQSSKPSDERQSKATLKIKAPPSTPTAAPAAGPGTKPPQPSVGARGKPITQAGGVTSGKTLKLKAVPRPTPTKQVVTPPVAAEPQVELPEVKENLQLETDVFYTISAVASLMTIGAVLYLMVYQFTSLF